MDRPSWGRLGVGRTLGSEARPIIVILILCVAISRFYSAPFIPYIFFLNFIFQLSLTFRITLCGFQCVALWLETAGLVMKGLTCEDAKSSGSGVASGPPLHLQYPV